MERDVVKVTEVPIDKWTTHFGTTVTKPLVLSELKATVAHVIAEKFASAEVDI